MTRNEKKLFKELTKNSFAEDWESVRGEWDFKYEYEVDLEDKRSCLCGKRPIKYMCVIENQKTKEEAKVGTECIKNFLCMSEELELYQVLKKLKDDITLSVNKKVLALAHSERVINDFEDAWYKKWRRKKSYQYPKVIALRKKLNQKILTHYTKHFDKCLYLNKSQFDQDLEAGKKIEQSILLLIQKKYHKAYIEQGYFKEWDIYVPELGIGVEVKSDQKSKHTGNIVIEIEFNGKPSALSTTKATYWVIYDGMELRWFLPSEIKRCIRENDLRYAIFTGRGDTKSKKAYLIRKELLYKYSHESNKFKRQVPTII